MDVNGHERPGDERAQDRLTLGEAAVLEALTDVGAAFTAERRLEPVLDRLLVSALRVAGGDAGSIMLLSREHDTLRVAAARGARAASIVGTVQPAERSVAGAALRSGQAMLVHGEAFEAPFASDHPRNLASSAVAPLSVGGRLVGVLSVSREHGAPRMEEQAARLLQLLANQAAILVDNAQMMEELQRKEERLEQLVDELLRESGRRTPERPQSGSVERSTLQSPLTAREQQVLDLLVDGLTNREIAQHLVVEPDTVKDHVQNIIKKLDAADRTHAAVIAVRTGLVS